MRKLAQSTYETWSRASPLERLSIAPPVEGELEQGKWSRVNARASTMIMASLDAAVSSEMVARRLTKSSPGLVFRLLTLYQPGREQEKGLIHHQLQSPASASTAQGAVDALRAWGRWLRRSETIGLTKPDPTILIRSLGMIVSLVLASEYHANFRTSLVRSALKVDTAPSYESVESFYQHLLAEMEARATGTATSAASSPTSPSAPPRVKELRTGTRNGETGMVNLQTLRPYRLPLAMTRRRRQKGRLRHVATSGRPTKGAQGDRNALSSTRGMDLRSVSGVWSVEERDTKLENARPRRQDLRTQRLRVLHQGLLRPLRRPHLQPRPLRQQLEL